MRCRQEVVGRRLAKALPVGREGPPARAPGWHGRQRAVASAPARHRPAGSRSSARRPAGTTGPRSCRTRRGRGRRRTRSAAALARPISRKRRQARCTASAVASWSGCPLSYGWVITASGRSARKVSRTAAVTSSMASDARWSMKPRRWTRSGPIPASASPRRASSARACRIGLAAGEAQRASAVQVGRGAVGDIDDVDIGQPRQPAADPDHLVVRMGHHDARPVPRSAPPHGPDAPGTGSAVTPATARPVRRTRAGA